MTTDPIDGQIVKRGDSNLAHGENAREVIATFSAWATALMDVVRDRKLYSNISGKQFLQFEAWQMIASFDGAAVDTTDVQEIRNQDGDTIGFRCNAKLMKHGEIIAGGSAIGGMDGFVAKGKSGFDQYRAVYSAVQTWAGSKACRMRYSTVATMAGYEVATADEMTPRTSPEPEQQHTPSPTARKPRGGATAASAAQQDPLLAEFARLTSDHMTDEEKVAAIHAIAPNKRWGRLTDDEKQGVVDSIRQAHQPSTIEPDEEPF